MEGELIYEYGKHPPYYGSLENPNFSHLERNVSCGEFFKVDLQIEDENVTDVKFSGESRIVGRAAMALLIEEIIGGPLQKVMGYDKNNILELIEVTQLTEKRMRSALLGLLSLKNCFLKMQKKPLLSIDDLMNDKA